MLANSGPEKCLRMWTPTAKYLSQKLPDHSFRIVPLSFDHISTAVRNEEVDFVLANPVIYMELDAKYGISRIATLKSSLSPDYPLLGGVIFTRADNHQIYELRDLAGKKFVAVAPDSLGGWLAALREFKKAGINPFKDFARLQFTGNHESVIYAVIEGKADAGTANTNEFVDLIRGDKIKLRDFRVIVPEWIRKSEEFPYPVSTRLYPDWPFAKLRGTSEDLATKVAIALLRMDGNDEAARAANCYGWSYPLNYQSIDELSKELRLGDYRNLREMSSIEIFHKYKTAFIPAFIIFVILLIASIILAYLYRRTKRSEESLIKNEQKLKTSNKQLEDIIEFLPDATLIVDDSGDVVAWNRAIEEMTGIEKTAIIGKHYSNSAVAFYGEHRPFLVDLVFQNNDELVGKYNYIEQKKNTIYAEVYASKLYGGKGAYIWITVSSLIDPNGHVIGGIESIRDITEHVETENQLKNMSHQKDLILRASGEGILGLDVNGNHTFVNPSAANMLGYGEDELIGRRSHSTWHHTKKNGEHYPEEECPIYKTFKDSTFHHNNDEVFWRKDGSSFQVSYTSSPILEQGRPIGAVVTFRDITKRKRLEEALVKSRELDQILVDALPYPAMLIQYPQRTILNANRLAKEAGARNGGICHRDFGKNIYVVGGTNHCSFCKADEMYEKQKSIITDKLLAYDKWWTVCWIPVKGNIYLHFMMDISERERAEREHKKLEEQIYHLQKMEAIGTLAGGVAHDFNNILTAITGFAGLAQTNAKEDPAIEGYMQQVLNAAGRAADLTKRLLAFSRKQVIEPVLSDLNEIVRNIEKMLRRILTEDIELHTVLSGRELPVLVDVGQIDQVLINLAANARDAMPYGGQLAIETDVIAVEGSYPEVHVFESTGTYAVLSVSDTGIGMDQETKENIFEPFFTTKEVGKGTGLGLSMVYGIIKQHNGNINVYSEIGKGTTFRIYLPLARTKRETIPESIHPLNAGKGETIIIAEDESQVREMMMILLQKNGYKIIEAVDGEDAVNKFRENKGTVSLVLLDVIMPRKNGKEAYAEIKGIEPRIKTIFMSGYTDDIISKNGILEEGFEFISKPIKPDALIRRIRDVLDR